MVGYHYIVPQADEMPGESPADVAHTNDSNLQFPFHK
jgi:hypothetical protein